MQSFLGADGGGNRRDNQGSTRNNDSNNNTNGGGGLMNFLRNVAGTENANRAGEIAAQAAAYAQAQAAHFADLGQHHVQHGPERPGGTPPASRAALRQLPTILVTPEDLVDPTNRECCICLEENHIHDKVVRLPCAHIFHQMCIVDWLGRNCSCPTCRYELPTDDPHYEADRIQRMRCRKPRYAKYELKRMNIRQLKSLLSTPRQLREASASCAEKRELVEYIIASGAVDIIAAPEPVEFPCIAVLRAMGISQLRRTMNEAGVFFDPKDVVEKEDMVRIFVNSGRICFADDNQDSSSAVDGSGAKYSYASSATTSYERMIPPPVSASAWQQSAKNDKTCKVVVETVGEYDEDDSVPGTELREKPGAQVIVETVGEQDDDESIRKSSSLDRTSPASRQNDWDRTVVMEETKYKPLSSSNAFPASGSTTPSIESAAGASPEVEINDSTTAEQQMLMEEILNQEQGEGGRSNNQPCLQSRKIYDQGTACARGEEIVDDAMEIDEMSEASRKRQRRRDAVDEAASQLQGRSIGQLRSLAQLWGVDVSDCIERSEMIRRLSALSTKENGAGGNDQTSQLSTRSFQSWSVSEIRASADAVDVDLSHCYQDQYSMVHALLEAARHRPHVARYLEALTPLMKLSTKELRALASEWHVKVTDCLERSEIIQRLAESKSPQARRQHSVG